MNLWYPNGKTLVVQGLSNPDPLKLALIADPGVYDHTDTVYADISSHVVGTPQTLTVTGVTPTAAGVYEVAISTSSVTFSGVTAATDVVAMVGFLDAGSDPLLWWQDTMADGTPLAFTANGAAITITLPSLLAVF